jgi:hypothetical protein
MNFLPALIKILYWVSSLVKLIIRARRDFLQAFGSNSFCISRSHCELRRIPEPCQEFHYQTEIRVLHKPYNWTDMYWFKFHSHSLHASSFYSKYSQIAPRFWLHTGRKLEGHNSRLSYSIWYKKHKHNWLNLQTP